MLSCHSIRIIGKMFAEHGLDWRAIERLEDLQRIPFTSKSDLSEGANERGNLLLLPIPANSRAGRPRFFAVFFRDQVAPGANSTGSFAPFL